LRLFVSQVNEPFEGEFEAANSRLNEGLKTCRSVVDNYKALLSADQGVPAQAADNDDGETPLNSSADG